MNQVVDKNGLALQVGDKVKYPSMYGDYFAIIKSFAKYVGDKDHTAELAPKHLSYNIYRNVSRIAWVSSDECINPVVATKVEKPCRIPTCGRPNYTDAHKCWWCEAINPTGLFVSGIKHITCYVHNAERSRLVASWRCITILRLRKSLRYVRSFAGMSVRAFIISI